MRDFKRVHAPSSRALASVANGDSVQAVRLNLVSVLRIAPGLGGDVNPVVCKELTNV